MTDALARSMNAQYSSLLATQPINGIVSSARTSWLLLCFAHFVCANILPSTKIALLSNAHPNRPRRLVDIMQLQKKTAAKPVITDSGNFRWDSDMLNNAINAIKLRDFRHL